MLIQTGEETVAFQGRRLQIRVQPMENTEAPGKTLNWEYLKVNNAVAVLGVILLNKDLHYVLLKHHRLPVTKTGYIGPIIEACAGVIGDKTSGEDALVAAKRELLEETGYEASDWRACGEFFSSPGITTETITLFIAEGLLFVGQQLEESEKGEIEVIKIKCSEAMKLLGNGGIKDFKTATLIMMHQMSRPIKPIAT